jgi:TrmH family RNA methyltransferase
VSGLSKNKIKWIRSLQLKKNRDDLGLFLVEGEKMVAEALRDFPEMVEEVYSTTDFTFPKFNKKVEIITETELSQISALKTPNKSLAILKKLNNKESVKSKGLILALDGVQDPGNIGTILRTADWFGIDTVVCSEDTADIYNPKVIQASMGSMLRMNVIYTSLENYLATCELPIFGALLEGENVYGRSLEKIGVLVMGNEGKGIRPNIKTYINTPIHIPGFGKAESLNVAVATGILLSEFKRREGQF